MEAQNRRPGSDEALSAAIQRALGGQAAFCVKAPRFGLRPSSTSTCALATASAKINIRLPVLAVAHLSVRLP